MISLPISGEEKRQALARVLDSRTFVRSDQLRAFLRYVCEAELEGRAQQLNEYVLGVSVLGRPPTYSPAEDSCVRSRAYELRNKLATYYRSEAPDDPIQIQVDKGAYVPRFERRALPSESPPPAPEPAADTAPASAPVPPTPAATSPAEVGRPRWPLLALVVVVVVALLTSLGFFWAARHPATPGTPPTREMEALWRPFLDSPAPLIVSFEIRMFLFSPDTGLVVRDFQVNQPDEVSHSAPLQSFRQRMTADELRPTYDYADFGAVHAAFLLGRKLAREVGLKHSSSLGWEDIWNSNIIFIGKPNLHPTVRHALKDGDFVDELGVIHNLHPQPGEPSEYRSATTHGAGQKYALITLLPGPQPGRRMMILSGAGAELMWALAESVTDPVRVREIMSHVMTPRGRRPRRSRSSSRRPSRPTCRSRSATSPTASASPRRAGVHHREHRGHRVRTGGRRVRLRKPFRFPSLCSLRPVW
jgi:hypothetical protein